LTTNGGDTTTLPRLRTFDDDDEAATSHPRGKPGTERILVLERSGKQVTVRARVVHLP